MPETNPVQLQVIAISRDYLGPASERFIDRQAQTHLNKSSDKITRTDLVKLVDWIRLAFALLTNDSRLVDEYAERLMQVAQSKVAKTSKR
jgi:hypothetical protein